MEPVACVGRLAAMPSRHQSRRVVHALIFVVLLSMSVIAGCGSSGGVVIPLTGPLVTVELRGGMCQQGACDHSVILERDGRVRSAAKPPNDLGVVPAEAMATLTATVAATDYAALTSQPFTGVCPIAFDGQELIFEFAVGAGTQRIASCEVDIDWGHPLFVAVELALGEWIPIPLT